MTTSKKNGQVNKTSPILKTPPLLFDKTQIIIKKIEKIIGEPLITYWNSPESDICSSDVNGMYALLKVLGKQEKLSLLIKSYGGNGQASLRMINLLREFSSNITALLPLECASAATMMALGANKICMGSLAYLSAVDTSLTHSLSPIDNVTNQKVSVSQDELERVVRLWKEQNGGATGKESNPYGNIFQYLHPLVIGAVDRSSALSIRICSEILDYHMKDKEKAAVISRTLNSEYPSHGYPITLKEARRIGLNTEAMDSNVNSLLLELNEIYVEMTQLACTDFDVDNYHSNTIMTIMESNGMQIFYQNDKDWHYRNEEKRWIAMNDNSGWRKASIDGDKVIGSILHIY